MDRSCSRTAFRRRCALARVVRPFAVRGPGVAMSEADRHDPVRRRRLAAPQDRVASTPAPLPRGFFSAGTRSNSKRDRPVTLYVAPILQFPRRKVRVVGIDQPAPAIGLVTARQLEFDHIVMRVRYGYPLQSFLRAQFGKGEPAAPASPSRGPGNGILRAETGGLFQPQNAGEQSEFGSQTTLRLTNPPELRGFLSTRKPPRFVGTAWWRTQSRETGLRRPNFAENALCCYCFLGGSKRRFSKRSNASGYNALADPEPIRRQQNNSKITANGANAANAAKCASLQWVSRS